ncbi:MAG: hypothetical protein ACKVQW_15765 [Pyrinomonadaceae bacterium]
MKKLILTLWILISVSVIFSQKGGTDDEVLLKRSIFLSDNKFHELEIKNDGIYLDRVRRNRSDGLFRIVTFVSETGEYWESDEGHWILVSTGMATGICGMPYYAMIYIDSNGNIRVSKESPPACIGDFPILIEFKLSFDKQCDTRPVWKISNSLEFDGCTFNWKDLQAKRKQPPRKKK